MSKALLKCCSQQQMIKLIYHIYIYIDSVRLHLQCLFVATLYMQIVTPPLWRQQTYLKFSGQMIAKPVVVTMETDPIWKLKDAVVKSLACAFQSNQDVVRRNCTQAKYASDYKYTSAHVFGFPMFGALAQPQA